MNGDLDKAPQIFRLYGKSFKRDYFKEFTKLFEIWEDFQEFSEVSVIGKVRFYVSRLHSETDIFNRFISLPPEIQKSIFEFRHKTRGRMDSHLDILELSNNPKVFGLHIKTPGFENSNHFGSFDDLFQSICEVKSPFDSIEKASHPSKAFYKLAELASFEEIDDIYAYPLNTLTLTEIVILRHVFGEKAVITQLQRLIEESELNNTRLLTILLKGGVELEDYPISWIEASHINK